MMINEIIHGDCLKVMRDIKSRSVDMILCDLPYGTTACKWDSIIPFDRLWLQYKRIIKIGGAIVLTSIQPFTSALVMSNPEMFKHEWIWEKENSPTGLHAHIQPMKVHENILVFGEGKIKYNPQKTRGHPDVPYGTGGGGEIYNNAQKKQTKYHVDTSGERFPRSVQQFNIVWRDKRFHPTQKPVKLFEYLIRTYTNEGDLVLDNCIGSGTTAVACINLNRNFIGIELDEGYHKIAVDRIQEIYDSSSTNVIKLKTIQKEGDKEE